MKRKMILKRITSFVCAMMVLIGAVGGAVPYKADMSKIDAIKVAIDGEGVDSSLFEYDVSLSYVAIRVVDNNGNEWIQLFGFDLVDTDDVFSVGLYCNQLKLLNLVFNSSKVGDSKYLRCSHLRYSFSTGKVTKMSTSDSWTMIIDNSKKDDFKVLYSDFDIYYKCTSDGCDSSFCSKWNGHLFYSGFNGESQPPYSSDIGFLKDFSHLIVYKRGFFYNYNMDSRTDRWTFSKFTTTENDLSSGRYSIKHYVRPVLVTGYEDEDVVEKYDKFFDDVYDAHLGYIQYLDNDMENKLSERGYDGPSWFDKYILGRFVLRWHYFELVDNETGLSSGFARLRPKDVDDVNGGTEYWVDYVDENDNIIDGTDGDVAYRGEGSYVESEDEDIEDAFVDAEDDVEEQEDHTNIANLDGVSIFASVMESFADSTASFSAVIGNFFNCLPPWVLTVFGLSVALTFLAFIIKNLR